MSKITHDFWLSSDVAGLDVTLNPYSVLPHTCFVPVIFLAYIYIPVYIIVKIVQNSKYFSYIVFQICDQYLEEEILSDGLISYIMFKGN